MQILERSVVLTLIFLTIFAINFFVTAFIKPYNIFAQIINIFKYI